MERDELVNIDQHTYIKCGGCGQLFHPMHSSEVEAYRTHECEEDTDA